MHAGWSVCQILPPKRYCHWNPLKCIGRPRQARKFPGSASRLVTCGCLCCWQRARRKRGKANQPGLRSYAPSFGLANHRARGDLSSPPKLHKRRRATQVARLSQSRQTGAGRSSLHLRNGMRSSSTAPGLGCCFSVH